MSGYVKFWRTTLEHELLANDNAAYIVFTKLLLSANRHNGKYITGRFRLGDLCNLKPTTAWKALKRLEKAQMVSLSSDNKKTTIYICNWSKWQGNGDSPSDNKVTTKGQQGVTKQEERIKNKEGGPLIGIEKINQELGTNFKPEKTIRKSMFRQKPKTKGYELHQAKEICQMFTDSKGGEYYNNLNIPPLTGLIQNHGIDKVREVAVYGLSLKPKEFQIEINKPVDLADHWPKIVELMERPEKDSKYGF